jgi:hypothetical protein
MCGSSSGRAAAFSSASGAALSQEIADGKIDVQSAFAMDTLYIQITTVKVIESSVLLCTFTQ